MLRHEVYGVGPPLLLLHGTPSSRREWEPLRSRLIPHRRVIAPDLPGFGASPRLEGAVLPRDWVQPIAELLESLGVGRCAVVGSSMGGWTALELARAGCATGVLALAPAGLWARRSPPLTNAQLLLGHLGTRLVPQELTRRALGAPALRRLALRSASADAGRVDEETAIAFVEGSSQATGWKQHYAAAKRSRFTGGEAISVPVRVVWGERDPIAAARSSRHTGELPDHTIIETWPDCGHLLAWDAPGRVAAAALALPT